MHIVSVEFNVDLDMNRLWFTIWREDVHGNWHRHSYPVNRRSYARLVKAVDKITVRQDKNKYGTYLLAGWEARIRYDYPR